ncbi:UvrD-helicase domain-containing protein [Gordonia phthalatica]|nr:UvrD-helicase domain-containing protein [Gordonia phthalatica]
MIDIAADDSKRRLQYHVDDVEQRLRAAEEMLAKHLEVDRVGRTAARTYRLNSDGIRESLKARITRDGPVAARAWLRHANFRSAVADSDFAGLAVGHVKSWCREHMSGFVPDDEQAIAIAAAGAHAIVEARAGSGKTATMIARAAYLIDVHGVDPRSIMFLAFNTAAAQEVADRLAKYLPDATVPHAMTFHALAKRIARPPENILVDSSETSRPLSRLVQTVIDEFVHDPAHINRVRDLMLEYARQDWAEISRRGDDLPPELQVQFRRSLRQETIRGEYVKSFGEKLIANTLAEHGIAYRYEKFFAWNGSPYHPDFTIFDAQHRARIVIEYFGMTGDADYDEQTSQKRAFWKEHNASVQPSDQVHFLEYAPRDIARPDFPDMLLADLAEIGLSPDRLSEDEIWSQIRKRSIGKFTDIITSTINRARQRRWSGSDLRAEWARFDSSAAIVDEFMELGAEAVDRYAELLVETSQIDFTGLLWRAVDEMAAGAVEFGRGGRVEGDIRTLRYIIVDEFQDFSPVFYELLRQVLDAAPQAEVMAVGDDWQAINEFAGSTTKYFTDFDEYFPGGKRFQLRSNRRSIGRVVALGNAVMEGHGFPAWPIVRGDGEIRELVLDDLVPTRHEAEQFSGDLLTPALLRLIASHLDADPPRSVAVLDRRRTRSYWTSIDGKSIELKGIEEYGARLLRLLDRGDVDVQFGTVHGFKGREADAVILTAVDVESYPLVHPTWALGTVFGDTFPSLVEAERRLFYVGTSRPKNYLDVLVPRTGQSMFWSRLPASLIIRKATWAELRTAVQDRSDRVEIRVFFSKLSDDEFQVVRSWLKENRFKFSSRTGAKYWWTVLDELDEDRARDSWIGRHAGVTLEGWQNDRLIFSHPRPRRPF